MGTNIKYPPKKLEIPLNYSGTWPYRDMTGTRPFLEKNRDRACDRIVTMTVNFNNFLKLVPLTLPVTGHDRS